AKQRNRRRACNLLGKSQSVVQTVATVMGDERAGEEFGGCSRFLERDELVGRAMLEEKDVLDCGGGLSCETGIAVPGRAVHAQLAILTAQDDAVVAQHACAGMREPEARRRALSGAGMADEQASNAVGSDHTAGVYFDSAAPGEAMDHQEFIQRVFERVDRE